MNCFEFKIDFISAQVTWHNLESSIARLIMTIDRHLRRGGGMWCISTRR